VKGKFKPFVEWGMFSVSNQHQTLESKGVSLLAYWTWRYVLVLLGVLLLIGITVGFWIRLNAYEQSYRLLEIRANQAAEVYETLQGDETFEETFRIKDIRINYFLFQVIDERISPFLLLRGKLVQHQVPLNVSTALVKSIRSGKTVEGTVVADDQTWLFIGVPAIHPQSKKTHVLIVGMPAHEAFPQSYTQYGLLVLLILTTALVGYMFIYFLSRKLTDPLLQVAKAAHNISEGHYHPLDLPEQVREQELQLMVGSFRNMATRLSHLENLRTDLLAGVSHELRTPITSIRGMIQAVRDRVVTDEEAEEFLHISLKETERLQAMVEDLLNLSSFEAGTVPLIHETIQIKDLIDEVIHQLRVLPVYAEVEFDVRLPADSLITSGDPHLLRQILLNLFNNSREASPPQTVITVWTERTTSQIRLYVQDQGHGVPLEDQPYIFERFYRGPGHKKSYGLGLGLTICRVLAQAHGGDLVLYHSTPAGTTFRLSLPFGENPT